MQADNQAYDPRMLTWLRYIGFGILVLWVLSAFEDYVERKEDLKTEQLSLQRAILSRLRSIESRLESLESEKGHN